MIGQAIKFECACGIGEQEQILQQGAIGCVGYVTCWSCGETHSYFVEHKSNLLPWQERFWERWNDSRTAWREKYNRYPHDEQEFKDFHNARVATLKDK